jgi:hypothetical protein
MSIKDEQVKIALLEAMEQNLGNITMACKSVGCARNTFYKHYRKDEEFKKQIDEMQSIALDFVENALMHRIKQGDTTAIIFYLKCKGKERGYVDRQVIDITKEIQISWEEVKTYHIDSPDENKFIEPLDND